MQNRIICDVTCYPCRTFTLHAVTVHTDRPPRSYSTHRSPYTQLLYNPIALHAVTVHSDRTTQTYCTHRSPYTLTVHTDLPTRSYCTHRSPYTVTVYKDRNTHIYCIHRYILVPVACIWYIMLIISIPGTVFFNFLITDRFKCQIVVCPSF